MKNARTVLRQCGAIIGALMLIWPHALAAQEKNMSDFYVKIIGPRPTFPDDMTPDEEAIMGEHFEYLKALTAQGIVVLAGPVFAERIGLIILRTPSIEDARRIMDSEPSVAKGLMRYEISPMAVALLATSVNRRAYPSEQSGKEIVIAAHVPISADSAWKLWTTAKGLESFMCQKAEVELRVGGKFEIYFNMDAPEGQRGSEGCRILAFRPGKMLAFDWNAPPQFPEICNMRTSVVVEFTADSTGGCNVSLWHGGWGVGEDWGKAHEYFSVAWQKVMDWFVARTQNAGSSE